MPYVQNIHVHNLPSEILGGTNELMVCLAQTPPPSKVEIRGGNASPKLMHFLSSFFIGNHSEGVTARLNDMVPN